MPEHKRHTEGSIFSMTNAERWAATEYLVEATRFEQFSLWMDWRKKCQMEAAGIGGLFTVGYLTVQTEEDLMEGGKTSYPMTVEVMFTPVAGHLVAFYNAASRVTDHIMVREWVERQCPPGTRHTDTFNFAQVLYDLGVQFKDPRR